MSTARIQSALQNEFERKRIVFWYDADSDWLPEFDAISLDGVAKLRVENDELAVKHRVTREAPGQKFLLYFPKHARPADTDNWLLDLLLAYDSAFSPDRASLAAIEAGLVEFKPLVAQHIHYFGSND